MFRQFVCVEIVPAIFFWTRKHFAQINNTVEASAFNSVCLVFKTLTNVLSYNVNTLNGLQLFVFTTQQPSNCSSVYLLISNYWRRKERNWGVSREVASRFSPSRVTGNGPFFPPGLAAESVNLPNCIYLFLHYNSLKRTHSNSYPPIYPTGAYKQNQSRSWGGPNYKVKIPSLPDRGRLNCEKN